MVGKDLETRADVAFYFVLVPDAAVIASHKNALVSLNLYGARYQLQINPTVVSWLVPGAKQTKIKRLPVQAEDVTIFLKPFGFVSNLLSFGRVESFEILFCALVKQNMFTSSLILRSIIFIQLGVVADILGITKHCSGLGVVFCCDCQHKIVAANVVLLSFV